MEQEEIAIMCVVVAILFFVVGIAIAERNAEIVSHDMMDEICKNITGSPYSKFVETPFDFVTTDSGITCRVKADSLIIGSVECKEGILK